MCLVYILFETIDLFRIRSKIGSGSCEALINEVRIKKLRVKGVGRLIFLSKNVSNGPMNMS